MSNISTWVDPLAQSFMVDTLGGVFATSVDLYFYSKHSNLPVTVQIREMYKGYPTQKVLPFSEVTLNAADVNVVDIDAGNDPDPNLKTKFTFESPVYLQDGVEYALVVIANSNDYTLWYAGIGEDEYGTEVRISKAPYTGVLFTAQNASTWSEDMNRDLKFTINRAVFDTNATGSLVLANDEPESRLLNKNPVRTTDGSSVVTIFHRNHGFFNPNNDEASYVTLSGFTDATSYNGILGSTLNGTHEIISVEQDSYKIDVLTAAVGTGITGGSTVVATQQIVYNTFMTNVQHLTFAGTEASWEVSTTDGISMMDNLNSPYTRNSNIAVINGKNFQTSSPMVVAHSDNMSVNSFEATCSFSSARANLSPVFDLERASVITAANRIDNPSATEVSNFNLVEDYIPETAATGGSAQAKYVTKLVTLNNNSSTVKAYLKVNRPSGSYVDVYYRAGIDPLEIGVTDWTLVNPTETIPFTDNPATFNEMEYTAEPGFEFNMFQIKIVFRSNNTSNVPVCKALRAIALA